MDKTLIDAALETMQCSQNELAKRAGVPSGRLSEYRSGKRELTFEAGVKIAAAAGLDAEAWAAQRARQVLGNAQRRGQRGTAGTGLLAVIAAAAGAALAGGLTETALMLRKVNSRSAFAS